ncbi:DUF6440 family protein [Streptococcus caprae]|uniref:DUF6440 family protein n=1 Tax=Streptococcus caprae TaxID=1640501 RepID=A0ABV8CSY1_9STRE
MFFETDEKKDQKRSEKEEREKLAERFELSTWFSLSLEEQGKLLVDKETGVEYLVVKQGVATAITPLLTADGKPKVRD